METIKKIRALLKGYKTYIVGGLTIAIGIYTQNNEMIMTGLGFITLRAGFTGK